MFVSGIDEVNGPTQDDSSNKCNRESDAVVRMKFQLGQQVSERDTDKDPGRRGYGPADNCRLGAGKFVQSQYEESSAQRTNE